MVGQISVKSLKVSGESLTQMYDEARSYLESIGFNKTALLSVTDKDLTLRTFLFKEGGEQILLEFKQDKYEEVLKLAFFPMEITFVYDILLMRFNQLSGGQKNGIFIYEE